jgi:hypothetical protein
MCALFLEVLGLHRIDGHPPPEGYFQSFPSTSGGERADYGY